MIHILFLKKTNFNNKRSYKNIYLANKISNKRKIFIYIDS